MWKDLVHVWLIYSKHTVLKKAYSSTQCSCLWFTGHPSSADVASVPALFPAGWPAIISRCEVQSVLSTVSGWLVSHHWQVRYSQFPALFPAGWSAIIGRWGTVSSQHCFQLVGQPSSAGEVQSVLSTVSGWLTSHHRQVRYSQFRCKEYIYTCTCTYTSLQNAFHSLTHVMITNSFTEWYLVLRQRKHMFYM